MIMRLIKKILYSLSAEAADARYRKAMHEFLSQATDHMHLEQLERQWEKQYGLSRR